MRALTLSLLLLAAPGWADIDRPESVFETLLLLKQELAAEGVNDTQIDISNLQLTIAGETIVNPDNIHNRLRMLDTGAERQAELSGFVQAILESLNATPRELGAFPRDQLFPVLRHLGFMGDQLEMVSWRPFAGDMRVFYAIDYPDRIEFLTREDQDAAGMTDAQVWALSLQNLQTKIDMTTFDGSQGYVVVTTDGFYESSLLLDEDLWNDVEQQLGDGIALAAPARDVVVFGRASDTEFVASLQLFADDIIANGSNQLSEFVYIWEDGTWVPQ